MNDATFPIEFLGGSQDGTLVEGHSAPEYCDLTVYGGVREIYERRTDEPPYIYVQVGYAGGETGK